MKQINSEESAKTPKGFKNTGAMSANSVKILAARKPQAKKPTVNRKAAEKYLFKKGTLATNYS